jgi:hypothetical protein
MERLLVVVDDEALPDAEVDRLALGLRRELLELPVDDVLPAPAGTAPDGARVGDVVAIGAFVVLLNSSSALLTSLVSTIRGWRRDTIPDGRIRLKLGDDEIELSGLSEAVETRLLEDWTRRHGG